MNSHIAIFPFFCEKKQGYTECAERRHAKLYIICNKQSCNQDEMWRNSIL